MFRCFFIQKRLYDYLDNALSEILNLKVKKHLEACPACQKRLSQMQDVLKLAESKGTPLPKEEFWHNFKIELDRKLNARLGAEFKFRPHLTYRLSPVLASSLVLIIVLAVAIFSSNNYPRLIKLAQSDTELIDEIDLLDELDSDSSFNHDEEAYIDELDLLDQLEASLTKDAPAILKESA